MQPDFISILRSKGLALAVHTGFWVLLLLIVFHFGGETPDYRESGAAVPPTHASVPVTRLEPLFSPTQWPSKVLETNSPSPFYTTAFLPTPKPPPPPPPPPPTTRKVTLVYQGFHEAPNTGRKAMFKTAEGFATHSLGGQVVTNHFVAEINMRGLTLTNSEGKTNQLLLNIPAELEIPIK